MSNQELMKNHETFLKTDFSEIAGEWVIISDGKLALHGSNLKMLLEKFEGDNPGKKCLIARAPTKKPLILASNR